MALKLDPRRSFFTEDPTDVELGDSSTIQCKYTIPIYATLEPLEPNKPLLAIQLTAIVAPTLPFDFIIGNTSIHQWNLYPWLQLANNKQLNITPTPLARILRRPSRLFRKQPSQQRSISSASITSALPDVNLRRIDGIDHIDPEIDDCPPDTFTTDIEGLPQFEDTTDYTFP